MGKRTSATFGVQALKCEITPVLKEVLDGLILGGASVISRYPFGSYLSIASVDLSFLEQISQQLSLLGIRQKGKIKLMKSRKREERCYRYESRCYAELSQFRKRWYPQGEKEVPRDLEVSLIVCRWWFLGKGHIRSDSRRYPVVVLPLQRFKKEEVRRFLLSSIQALGFNKAYLTSKGIIIPFPQSLEFLAQINVPYFREGS